ncbi:hypothetical protein [Xanthomonas axonopodis]
MPDKAEGGIVPARELQAGIAAIECALTRRFAWLSPLACRHLARAASYQWR